MRSVMGRAVQILANTGRWAGQVKIQIQKQKIWKRKFFLKEELQGPRDERYYRLSIIIALKFYF